jgi:hypothetical protein
LIGILDRGLARSHLASPDMDLVAVLIGLISFVAIYATIVLVDRI